MSVLSRDAILAAAGPAPEPVAVPEWGGTVLVRGLTAAERDAFELHLVSQRDGGSPQVRAWVVARAVVDGDGRRVFLDDDVAALGGQPAAALERVFARAERLSGLRADAVERAEKN